MNDVVQFASAVLCCALTALGIKDEKASSLSRAFFCLPPSGGIVGRDKRTFPLARWRGSEAALEVCAAALRICISNPHVLQSACSRTGLL